MTIQQALIEYPTIPEQIEQIKRGMAATVESMRDVKITAGWSDMPGSGNISNPTMDRVMDMEDRAKAAINRALGEIDELMIAQEWVDRGLRVITPNQRKVIELKYFDQVGQWDDIAKRTNYAKSHCKNLHREAIKTMRNIIPNSTK